MNGDQTCQSGGTGARALGGGAGYGTSRRRRSSGMVAAALLAIALTGCGGASVSPSAKATASRSAGPTATIRPTATATVRPTAQVEHGVFGPGGPMADGASATTATLLLDGRVLIGEEIGEALQYGQPAVSPAELYDPTSGAFTQTGSMAHGRYYDAAVRLLDGRVLVAGGNDSTSLLKSAELYDPATGKFSPTGSMLTAREEFSATLLLDGRVLITGGLGDDGIYPLAAAELYDPATGRFSPTGSMITARENSSVTRLLDGRVLIAGGDGYLLAYGELNFTPYASAELYDPRTGKFSATGSMTAPRTSHAATLLGDGRVLVSGGLGPAPAVFEVGPYLDSAELFDPATGNFSPTGSMIASAEEASATLLLDGRGLVMPTAELYDPATGSFSLTGSGRAGPFSLAVRLLDGRVLVIENSINENGAEIYTP